MGSAFKHLRVHMGLIMEKVGNSDMLIVIVKKENYRFRLSNNELAFSKHSMKRTSSAKHRYAVIMFLSSKGNRRKK